MKQEHQTKAASKQTLLSLIILGVLAIIAGGVFTAQFSYFAAVRQLASDMSAGDKTQPAPAAAAEPAAEPALISPPAGQIPMTPMEAFDAATLSDKINGKAELYLSAGFKSLHSQRLKSETAGDVWMEVFVYDMQTPQNAFSVFSAQRREDAQTLDLGQYGYQTANAIFFVHGPFYVEIVASDRSEAILEAMHTFAETFIAAHSVRTQAIEEKALFPKTGLLEDSIALVSADAFGYERFDQIFTATYQLGDIQLMAYLSRRKSPGEAQELAGSYADFLMAFGGSAAESDLAIPSAKIIYILDTYEIVCSHGPYLIGVREATAQQPAQDLALQLYNRIKEATGESDVPN
ncbi:MAG: hypothetical protein JRF36_13180 [Deltaproteobacteria bacterium]|nr:hypothetical protein [Deltaproteobacteria bacterium]